MILIPITYPSLHPAQAFFQVLAFETLALVSDKWSLNSPGLVGGGREV